MVSLSLPECSGYAFKQVSLGTVIWGKAFEFLI